MNELVAQDGYWLTQLSVSADNERIFVRKVKGINATDEYWEEWTDAEKVELEESHQQKKD